MSLTQDRGDFIFECDGKGCHETIETRTGNFEAARNQWRRYGWKARKVGEDWKHFCQVCQ